MTCDGRLIQGTLAGYDQLQNLIIKDAQERVYQLPKEQGTDADENTEMVVMIPLGLYLIRVDNLAVVSDLREGVLEEQDKSNYDGFENGEAINSVCQAGF